MSLITSAVPTGPPRKNPLRHRAALIRACALLVTNKGVERALLTRATDFEDLAASEETQRFSDERNELDFRY